MKKLKMILAAPAIVAFFTLFQIETQAQITESLIVEQVTENSKIEEDSFNIMIHPSYDNVYYERIEKMLNEKYHLEVKFSNLKRNEKGELTDYIITCKNNIPSSIGPFKPSSKNPINPSTLHIYRNKKGTYSLDLLSDKKEHADIIIQDKKLDVQQTYTNNLAKKSSNTTPQTEYKEENNTRITIKEDLPENILYILNGNEISETDFRRIQPNDIESINVLKDKKAIDKYGEKGKEGVLEIQLKDKPKMDIKVSVQLEKNSDNISEDFALFETIFDSAKSAKTYESNDVKISSIEATLTTDKNKFSKKVTY